MPILFITNPLGCLIHSGKDDGLTLAVMAAPCELQPPLPKFSRNTEALLMRLQQGPHRHTDALRWRFERLREARLVERRQNTWHITARGRSYVAHKQLEAATC